MKKASILLVCCGMLYACQSLAVTGKIRASMYAVPVDQITKLGAVRLNCTVSENSYYQVWVSCNQSPEVLFASGQSEGNVDAPWIVQGASCTFRLYAATGPNIWDKSDLLDSAVVVGIAPINPGVGQNKMDIFMQYLGVTSGCDGTSEYKALLKAMAVKSIRDAAEIGTDYIRVAVSGYGVGELLYWIDDSAEFWNSMDEMFNEFNNQGVKIVATLVWNVMQFPQYTNEDFREYVTNPASQAYIKSIDFISQFVERYKNNPALLFYELNNEMNLMIDLNNESMSPDDPLAGNVTTDEMIEYNYRVAQTIRAIDPYHMICSGYGCPRSSATHLRSRPHWVSGGDWGLDDINEFKDYLIDSHEGLDIISLHPYNIYNDNERFGYSGHYNVQYIDHMKEAADETLKLLYLGEIGDADPYSIQDVTCQFSQNVFDKVQDLQIPYSAPWVWEFYQGDTYSDNLFNIDPPLTVPLIDKILETNIALGRSPVVFQNPDITPPQNLIVWPLTGATLNTNLQNIYVKASDNNRLIDRVDFLLDGQLLYSDTDYPFEYALHTDTLPECDYEITSIAYDAAGNPGISSISVHGGDLAPCISGIPQETGSSGWMIYPNPCNNYLHIITNIGTPDVLNYKIYTLRNQLVMEGILSNEIISLEGIPAGTYILRIESTNFINFEKILKL